MSVQDVPEPPFVIIDKETTLYRGVPNGTQQPYYKPNQPQWFSHDSNHDYIEMYVNTVSGFKVTYQVNQPIRVINLKNEMVRNLLNVAIDRLQTTSISDLLERLGITNLKNDAYKNNLKSTYGGITFHEQLKAVYEDNETIKDRVNKITRFPEFIVNNQNLMGFRHSVDRYDRLLCYLIVKVFPFQFEYFAQGQQLPILGWIHNEWQTPWHDKNKDGSQIFKTEVALFLPDYNYLATSGYGGAAKLRQITPKIPQKLKNRGPKKHDGAPKDSTRVRHSSRKEPRAPL